MIWIPMLGTTEEEKMMGIAKRRVGWQTIYLAAISFRL